MWCLFSLVHDDDEEEILAGDLFNLFSEAKANRAAYVYSKSDLYEKSRHVLALAAAGSA